MCLGSRNQAPREREVQKTMDNKELLYDHYKETFSLIKDSIKQRNRLFVWLFSVMAVHFLFAASPESILAIIVGIVQKRCSVDISNQMSIIQSSLWVLLLYLTMRYYQSTVYIERQYRYIHSLEADIAKTAGIKFDREGTNYLLNYPKMNDFIDILYKWFFPLIYAAVICYKIAAEYNISFSPPFSLFNGLVFLACLVLDILYLAFLHGKPKKGKEARNGKPKKGKVARK